MKIELKIAKPQLLMGESSLCQITVTNTNVHTVTLPGLRLSDQWPVFRVKGPDNELVSEFNPEQMWEKREIYPVALDENESQELLLKSGQHHSQRFQLLNQLILPRIGKYVIDVIIRVHQQLYQSNPISVEVQAFKPKFCTQVYSHSGIAPLQYLAFVHDNGDGSGQLHFRCFSIIKKFVERLAYYVSPIELTSKPSISISPNGMPYADHWIVWSNNKQLSAVAVSLEKPLGNIQSVELNANAIEFMGAPCVNPTNQSAEALIWFSNGESGNYARIRLTPTLALAAKGTQARTKPLWTWNAFFTEGERRLFTVVKRAEGVQLDHCRWEDLSSFTLATWHWNFINANAMLSEDNCVFGAILGFDGNALHTFICQSWQLDIDNVFKLHDPIVIALEDGIDVIDSHLEIDSEGKPHILVFGSNRHWYYIEQDNQVLVCPVFLPEGAAMIGIQFAFDLYPVILWHNVEGVIQTNTIGFQLEPVDPSLEIIPDISD